MKVSPQPSLHALCQIYLECVYNIYIYIRLCYHGFPWWLSDKVSACIAGEEVQPLCQGDSPGKEMAIHSNNLAWDILSRWTWRATVYRVTNRHKLVTKQHYVLLNWLAAWSLYSSSYSGFQNKFSVPSWGVKLSTLLISSTWSTIYSNRSSTYNYFHTTWHSSFEFSLWEIYAIQSEK